MSTSRYWTRRATNRLFYSWLDIQSNPRLNPFAVFERHRVAQISELIGETEVNKVLEETLVAMEKEFGDDIAWPMRVPTQKSVYIQYALAIFFRSLRTVFYFSRYFIVILQYTDWVKKLKASTNRALKKKLQAWLLEGAQVILEVLSTFDKGQHYTLTVTLASHRFNRKWTCAGYRQFG